MTAPLITSAGNATPPWLQGGLVPQVGTPQVNLQTPYSSQPQVSPNLQAGTPQTQPVAQQTSLTNPQQFGDLQSILSMFQPQQTPQQQAFQSQQQAALDRLTGLEQQLSQSNQTSPELASLRTQIADTQKALKGLTPEKYLQSQPGLKGMEVSNQFLERRVAQERDPIASTLSELLTSESILSQSQKDTRQSLLDQANLIQSETSMRESLQKLQPETGLAGLPEGVQSKIMEQFLGLGSQPTSVQEYNYAQQEGFGGNYTDFLTQKSNYLKTVVNPLTGEITYYQSKPGFEGGTSGGGTSGSPTGVLTPTDGTQSLPPQLQAALTTVGGLTFLDEGKLADAGQKKIAQAWASNLGIKYLDETSAKNIKESFGNLGNASALLNQIAELASKAITAKSTSGVVGQQFGGLLSTLPIIGNLQADKKLYNAAVDSFLSLLTRAAGEKGVLTNTDVGRIKKALPTYDDTVAIANQKITNLSTVYNSVVNGALNAYLGDTPNKTSGQTSSGIKYTIE